jgi:hypothetical protein
MRRDIAYFLIPTKTRILSSLAQTLRVRVMISMLARKAQRSGAMKMRDLKRISILTAGEKVKSTSPVKTKRRMRWILLRLRTQRLVYVEPTVPVGHDA